MENKKTKAVKFTGSWMAFILVFHLWWTVGIVLAQGFWSTTFAVICPPWASYLAVEFVMRLTKLIST